MAHIQPVSVANPPIDQDTRDELLIRAVRGLHDELATWERKFPSHAQSYRWPRVSANALDRLCQQQASFQNHMMAELYGLRKSIDRLFGRFYYGGPKAPKVLAAKVRCWEQLQTVIFAPASAYWAGDLGAGLGAWLEELKHGYANQPQWAQAITADFNLGVLHEHRARAAIVLLRIEDGVSVVRDAQAVADIFTGYIVDLGWGIDRVPKAEWEEFLERAVPVVQKAGELDRLFRLSRCDYRLASNVEQATTGKTASPPAGLAHYGLFKCGDPGVYTYDVTPIEVVPVKRACDWRY